MYRFTLHQIDPLNWAFGKGYWCAHSEQLRNWILYRVLPWNIQVQQTNKYCFSGETWWFKLTSLLFLVSNFWISVVSCTVLFSRLCFVSRRPWINLSWVLNRDHSCWKSALLAVNWHSRFLFNFFRVWICVSLDEGCISSQHQVWSLSWVYLFAF